MKIITLKPDQFDKYASTHKYRSYYQSTAYGNIMLKFGYNVHYLGFVDNNNDLIGATLIIYKDVFMNNKIAYAPRGMLFDYTNPALVSELAEKLKSLLGKQNFMLLRMDPLVPVSIRDNTGNIVNINNDSNITLANLKSVGFQHKGQNLFFETEKPRFEALVVLNKNAKDSYYDFDKRTRYKIRKASKSGVEIFIDEDNEVGTLYDFIKDKYNKPLDYYQKLCEELKNSIDIYYAKLNTENYVIATKNFYENEMENNENLSQQIQDMNIKNNERKTLLNKKMESDRLLAIYKKDLVNATSLLKEYPNGIVIGGALTIKYDNAAYLIIEGFDEKYKSLNSNYLIKWTMIEDYQEKHMKYLNLNAVTGEFEKENKYSGLNEMKLGFNSQIVEYIGEFDIVLNNLSYNIFRSLNKDGKK